MTWNEANAKTWDGYLKTAPAPVSLQQAYAYGHVFEDYTSIVHRAVITKNDTVVALCQFLQHRFLKFFPLIVAFKGPVWLTTISDEEKTKILSHIRKNLPAKRHLFALESNLQNTEIDTAKRAGYHRVITGASTVWIDLRPSEEKLRATLDGKWRNALVKSEKSGITIKKLGKKPSDYDWLITEEGEQRKSRGYWALPDHFIASYVEHSPKSQPILTLAAMSGKTRIAGMMFLIHGQSATYHLGWSNGVGRKHNAHNQLLWEAMIALKKRGIQWLDLGGVNSKDIPGLTRFKIGTGGNVVSYAGTFMPKVFG